jgi:hypothetical protein
MPTWRVNRISQIENNEPPHVGCYDGAMVPAFILLCVLAPSLLIYPHESRPI